MKLRNTVDINLGFKDKYQIIRRLPFDYSPFQPIGLIRGGRP